LQPFNGADARLWGDGVSTATPAPLPGNLAALTELDNMDKHRVVQSVWLAPDIMSTRPWTDDGLGLYVRMAIAMPLTEGMEIGRFNFVGEPPPIPEWLEPRRYFPLHMSIREPWFVASTLTMLGQCTTAVRMVLDMFEPCIGDGDEPGPLSYWDREKTNY
jgi:hypothetical protein